MALFSNKGGVLSALLSSQSNSSKSSKSSQTTSVQTGTVSGDVNFRKGPGTGYDVIRLLKSGTSVEILGKSGSWYNIRVNGTVGYASEKYIKTSGSSAKSETKTETKNETKASTETAKITSAANFRKGPGSNYGKIKELPKGTSVEVLGNSGEWGNIKVAGTIGYVHNSLISTGSSSSSVSNSKLSNGQNKAIAFARSECSRGAVYKSSSGCSLCQGFVSSCYKAGTGIKSSFSSALAAKEACKTFHKGTSGIQPGAAIYMSSSTYPQYGHVGIYVSNGECYDISSSNKCKPKKRSLSDYSGWTSIYGWGWDGDHDLRKY